MQSIVGAGLLANAVVQSTNMLDVLAPSRASPLPQVQRYHIDIDAWSLSFAITGARPYLAALEHE
ncbi:hypothetical protein EYC95_13145 [Pseudomonas sp. BGI-2]|nr:hypothetical protein EYC95_13145 [Pseudomonas sp. BGI-2]